MRIIKDFKTFNESQFNKTRCYVATISKDADIDSVVKKLDILGCEIKKVHPYGVITFNYDGNIDTLKSDDIENIVFDKLENTYK